MVKKSVLKIWPYGQKISAMVKRQIGTLDSALGLITGPSTRFRVLIHIFSEWG
jgi:hypothetical protein